jgi:hypothetical protein
MIEIERTVIGSEGGRWHPINPFQVKRHGEPKSPGGIDPGNDVAASQSWKWLMERLAYLPQVRLVFGEQLPQSISGNRNFVNPQGVTRPRC